MTFPSKYINNKPVKFLVFYIPIILISYFGITQYFNTITEHEAHIALNSELDELSIKKVILSDFYTTLVEDINLLTWEYSHMDYMGTPNLLQTQVDFFKHFSSIQKSYDQVRYLDTLGNEKIRVDFEENSQGQFIEQQYLQNKNRRYYFQKAIKLLPGEIYFSDIDLNIENNHIEVPYKPVIRVAKKSYDKNGKCKGVIITNHFINNLTDKLSTYDENIHSSFELVNQEGYWLMSSDSASTFGHLKPGADTLNLRRMRMPLWEKIQNNKKGICRSKHYSYVFLKFTPQDDIDSKFSNNLVFNKKEEFVLISKIKNQDLSKNALYNSRVKWLSFLVLSILFALIIIGIQFTIDQLAQKNSTLKKSESALSILKDKLENTLELKLNELAINERKFYTLVNHAGIGVALIGLDGKPEFANHTLCNILGYSLPELSQKTFQELSYPQDIEKDDHLYNKLIRKEIDNYCIEKRYIRKDGNIIWGDLSVSSMLSDENEIINIIATVSDITEKKHHEERLFDNKQILNQVFEAVVSTDKDGILNFWNKGAEELFGYKSEEALGQHASFLYKEKETNRVQYNSRIAKLFKERAKLQEEETLSKKNGLSFIAQLSLSIRYDSYGKIIGSIISIIDISIQKEYEQKILQINKKLEERVQVRTKELEESYLKIKEREYRLNAAFSEGDYGWWDYHLNSDLIISHPSRYLTLGYTESEVENTSHWWDQLIHPDDAKIKKSLLQAITAGEKDSLKIEIRLKHKNGHYVWFYDQGHVIHKDHLGNPVRMIGTTQNIEQRKTMEIERLKLTKAVEQSQVVVEITDTNGTIEYVNPAFETLTGYTQKEVIGKNPQILNAHVLPKETYKNLWQTILKGDTWEGELCNKTKSGDIFWEMAIISPIRNEKGDIINFIAVKEDITEKRKAIKELKKAKTDAIEANKAKSEFLANMSHEIRTPMNAVIGFTDLLYRQIKNPTQLGYLNSIKVSGKNLLKIINDILDLAKIEAGKIEVETAPINISELIGELESTFRILSERKGLQFSIQIDENVCSTIFSDDLRINQILYNLISNAIKFTEKGYVTVKVQSEKKKTEDQSMEEPSNIQFIVEDSGIGINKDMQNKIFESFTQQDAQDTRKYGGTGLGLTISKKLAHILGGDISVISKQNQGSTFIFSLNQLKCLDVEIDTKIETPENQNIIFESNQILVIDDISTNRDFLKSALQELGLDVILAHNGEDAFKMIEKKPIDLVLCDLKMPVMDGYNFIRKLRNTKYKHIPCIVVTASVLNDELEKVKQYDFNGILIKPIQIEKLILELKKHLTYSADPTVTIIENESSHSISKQELDIIKHELNATIMPIYHSIKEQQSFEKLYQFADAIHCTGKDYNINSLTKYAEEFRQSVEDFNIEKILKMIKLFGRRISN
jgi:PAS domain S-box-containing protein